MAEKQKDKQHEGEVRVSPAAAGHGGAGPPRR